MIKDKEIKIEELELLKEKRIHNIMIYKNKIVKEVKGRRKKDQ